MTKHKVKDIYGVMHHIDPAVFAIVGDVEKDDRVIGKESHNDIEIWSHRAKNLIQELKLELTYGINLGITKYSFKVYHTYGDQENAYDLSVISSDKKDIEKQLKINIKLAKQETASILITSEEALADLNTFIERTKHIRTVRPRRGTKVLFTYEDENGRETKCRASEIGERQGVVIHNTNKQWYGNPVTHEQLEQLSNTIKLKPAYMYNRITHSITTVSYLLNLKTYYITAGGIIVDKGSHNTLYIDKRVAISEARKDIHEVIEQITTIQGVYDGI